VLQVCLYVHVYVYGCVCVFVCVDSQTYLLAGWVGSLVEVSSELSEIKKYTHAPPVLVAVFEIVFLILGNPIHPTPFLILGDSILGNSLHRRPQDRPWYCYSAGASGAS
jgi:hypothetical protein